MYAVDLKSWVQSLGQTLKLIYSWYGEDLTKEINEYEKFRNIFNRMKRICLSGLSREILNDSE